MPKNQCRVCGAWDSKKKSVNRSCPKDKADLATAYPDAHHICKSCRLGNIGEGRTLEPPTPPHAGNSAPDSTPNLNDTSESQLRSGRAIIASGNEEEEKARKVSIILIHSFDLDR